MFATTNVCRRTDSMSIIEKAAGYLLSSSCFFWRYNLTELKNEALIPIHIWTVAKCSFMLNTVYELKIMSDNVL